MFATSLVEEYDDEFFTNDYISDDKDFESIPTNVINLGDGIYEVLESFIENEAIEEEFTSESNAFHHFQRHCNKGAIKSTRQKVFYNLNYEEYLKRESYVDDLVKKCSNKYTIYDIYDYQKLNKLLRELFEGGKTIHFDNSCMLYNQNGRVNISLHSWATEVTPKYINNTIDFIVQSPDGKTITLYPIDANYLENKLNNEFKRCGFPIISINH